MSKPIPQLALNGVYLCSNCNLQDHSATRFHSNIRTSFYNSTCQNHSYFFDNANYGNNRSTNYPFHGHQLRHYRSANKLHHRYATSMENSYDPSSPLFSYFFLPSSFCQEEMNRNQERHINQYHYHYHHYYCYPPYNVFDTLDNQNKKENREQPSTPSCSTTFYDKPHQYISDISTTTSVQEERLRELDAYYHQLQHSSSEGVDNMGCDLDPSQEKKENKKGKKKKWVHFNMKKK